MEFEYKLIIFDLDGTLADRDTSELLPGVLQWFQERGARQRIALATNQGGVGLRHWMETDSFGDPSKFPTVHDVLEHIGGVLDHLTMTRPIHAHVCYAYQSKKTGKWSPRPKDISMYDSRWWPTHRKPNTGMLWEAMWEVGANPDNALMVGDGEEDKTAAENVGMSFCWAWEFFGRDAPKDA